MPVVPVFQEILMKSKAYNTLSLQEMSKHTGFYEKNCSVIEVKNVSFVT